jgi:hypothetical protein
MKRDMVLTLLLAVLATTSWAQHGKIEESGFYNFPYKGDTWTGEIVSLAQRDATITLNYTDKRGHSQTFIGKLQPRVKAYVKGHPEQRVTQLSVGDRVVAYYIAPGQKYFVLDENGRRKDAVATQNIVFEVAVFPRK